MTNANISSNQVAKNAPIFLTADSPELYYLDPSFVRIISANATTNYINAYLSGGDYGGGSGPVVPPSNPVNPVNPKTPAVGKKFPPDLSDILIYKQEIDYTVNPPKVNITFRVKNSTGLSVVGLNMLVPKQ